MADVDTSVGILPQPTRHPLLLPCIAVLIGSYLGIRTDGAANGCLWVCVGVFCIWFYLMKRAERSSRWLLPSSAVLFILTVCVAFFWSAHVSEQRTEATSLFGVLADQREDVVLCGRVMTEPAGRKMRHGGARLRFDFEVLQMPLGDGKQRMQPYRISVDWYGSESLLSIQPPFPIPEFGEGWQLSGRLRQVQTRAFSPLTVLQVRKRSPLNERCSKHDFPAIVRFLGVFRKSASHTLSMGMDEHPHSAAIIKAMTLGFRSEIPPEVMHAFRLSGTVHVFAISGLHVGIVATLIMLLLSLVPIPGRYRVLVFGPLIVAYTFMTGAKPSAVRACVMSLFFFSGLLLDRRADPLSSLCAAAILILAMNPLQVLDLGFVFSFVCAAGIILLVPVINGILLRGGIRVRVVIRTLRGRFFGERISIHESGEKMAVWISFSHHLSARIVQALAVSIAAWLASTPVTAMFFGRITPVAMVCNLFVIPLAFLIVVTAALSIVAGFIHPAFSALINAGNVWFAECLVYIAKTSSELPGASFAVKPWGVPLVIAWYGVVFLVYGVARAALSRPQ